MTHDPPRPYPRRVSSVAPDRRPTPPPARQIRLLGLAPAAGVVFALLALGSAVSVFRGVAQLASGVRAVDEPVWVAVVLVLLGAAAAVVFALVAHRLLVRVPRTLRGWQDALAERSRALRGE